MDSIQLTNKQARRFILAHQCLLPPYQLTGKDGVIEFIKRVGCIQFDPLDVVGRNPELVLQSRIDNYRPDMLEELLYEDRKLLDGWDKLMAIYRIEDWPYFYPRQRQMAGQSARRMNDQIKEVSPKVYKEIEERGPLSSIDMDHDQKVAWSWGPTRVAKAAAENMFYLGELVIHHKVHTRRVYDLASRHIPEELLSAPDPNKTQEQYHEWHLLRRIAGIGLMWNTGSGLWRGIYGAHSKERVAAMSRMIEPGEAVEVQVEGIKVPLYMRSMDMPDLEKVMKSDDIPPGAAFIAPLDNLMWERDLIEAVFGFRYRWEVYKPVAEREYGYYVLPVLYGDRFIARFEPVRRKDRVLEIKNWWWEPDIDRTRDMNDSMRDCFTRFMNYLDVSDVRVSKALVKREGLNWLS